MMSDVTSTLLAVIVGGALTVGAPSSDLVRSNLGRQQSERDRLRENLYALQDTINDAFNSYQASAESKNGHGAAWSQENNAEVSNTTSRTVMKSGRIGDSQINHHPAQVIANLWDSHNASDPREAEGIFSKTASTLMPPLGSRIEELLHTNAKVDHKVGSWGSASQPDMDRSSGEVEAS